MSLQGDRNPITLPITGGVIAANTIVAADAANPGNGKQAVAGAAGFLGVTLDAADRLGYTAVTTRGVVRVRVGAAPIAAGDQITSDANGNAITQPVAAGGAAVKMVIGVALGASVAGALVDVLIQPKYTTQ